MLWFYNLPSRLCFCTLFVLPVFSATSGEWRKRSIYQLVTDRFATTDGSSVSCDTTARKHCGGTWQGVIRQLDYIQSLGFDAVLISPVVKNIEGETPKGEAYHGYWSQDLTSTNSRFGTPDDLKALSKALHDRKMFLMLDVVLNHMATTQSSNSSSLVPFHEDRDFHQECYIAHSNNQTEIERCRVGDESLPLLDLNTEDATVITGLQNFVKDLVEEYEADGLKLDAVKHIRPDFWLGIAKAAGVFTLAQVMTDTPDYLDPYTEVIHAVLDYPSWYYLTAAFQSPSGNLSALTDVVSQGQKIYQSGMFMTASFLENHEHPRFPSLTQDPALIKNAMAWPFVQDGIPMLYYGQEQGYQGGTDPNNREALWLSGYETNGSYASHIRTLNGARRAAKSKNHFYLTTATKYIEQPSNSTLAVWRPPLLALLTNAGSSNAAGLTWNVSDVYKPNEQVVDVLTCRRFLADSSGGVDVQINEGMPQILLPSAALDVKGKLCPDVATGTRLSSGGYDNALVVSRFWWVVRGVTLALFAKWFA